LLVWPRPVLEQVHHPKVDPRSVVIARILGALGLAVNDRPWARAGLTDAAVAGAWAALGFRNLGAGMPPRADHERRRDRLARRVLSIVPEGHFLIRRANGIRLESRPGR
jgi:hypothetical protein